MKKKPVMGHPRSGQPSSDMVEKIARVLHLAAHGCHDKPVPPVVIALWEDCEMWQEMCRHQARAVIEAMRGATPEMKFQGLRAMVENIESRHEPHIRVTDEQVLSESEAAQHYMRLGAVMRSSIELDAAYDAMINAALDEGAEDSDLEAAGSGLGLK